MFYDKYVKLCASIKKSPSAVAEEVGVKRSNVTHWKAGRNGPSDVTIARIAEYFGVAVEYLKDEEQKENPGIPKDTEVDPIRAELFNLIEDATDADRKYYLDILRVAVSRHEKR